LGASSGIAKMRHFAPEATYWDDGKMEDVTIRGEEFGNKAGGICFLLKP